MKILIIDGESHHHRLIELIRKGLLNDRMSGSEIVVVDNNSNASELLAEKTYCLNELFCDFTKEDNQIINAIPKSNFKYQNERIYPKIPPKRLTK